MMTLIFSGLLLTSNIVQSQELSKTLSKKGTESGGGGGVVPLPDGQMVVADPFIVNGTRTISINPKFKNYLYWTNKVLSVYSNNTLSIDTTNLLNKVHIVEALPPDTDCTIELSKIPNVDKQEIAACTTNDETYIVKSLYNSMNLANQMSLLLHERLHAYVNTVKPKLNGDYAKTHFAIAETVSGTIVALTQLKLQLDGSRKSLSDQDYNYLTLMIDGITKLSEQTPLAGYSIYQNGGGLISSQIDNLDLSTTFQVDPTVFIGINSKIDSQIVSIAPRASVINSIISGNSVRLSNDVVIENSNLDSRRNISIKGSSIVKNSNLIGSILTIGSQSKISSTAFVTAPLVNNVINVDFGYHLDHSFVLPDTGKIVIGDSVDLEGNNLDLSFTVENIAKINHRTYLFSLEPKPYDNAFSVHYNLTFKNSVVMKGLLLSNGNVGSTLRVLGSDISRQSALANFDGAPDIVFAENTQIDFESNPFMGCSKLQHGFQDVGNGIRCGDFNSGCSSVKFGVERSDFAAVVGLHSIIAQSSDVEKMFCR